MANTLVEQLRRAYPDKTAGASDAELTDFMARSFEARGDLPQILTQYPDFHADLQDARVADSSITREAGARLKAGVVDRLPATAESLLALGADAASREELMQAMGLDEPLAKAGAALRGRAKQNLQAAEETISAAGGRAVPRLSDIRASHPVSDFMRFAIPTAAESAPSMGLLLGSSIAAGAAAGPEAALPVLAAGSIAQGMGDEYANVGLGEGVDRDKAIQSALLAGTGEGLLNMLPEVGPLQKIFRGAAGSKVAEILGRAGGLQGAASGAIKNALIGGATAPLQEALKIAAEEEVSGKPISGDEIASRLVNAAGTGAIIAAPLGAAFGSLPGPKTEPLQVGTEPAGAHIPGPQEGSIPSPAPIALDPNAGLTTAVDEGVGGPTPVDDLLYRSRGETAPGSSNVVATEEPTHAIQEQSPDALPIREQPEGGEGIRLGDQQGTNEAAAGAREVQQPEPAQGATPGAAQDLQPVAPVFQRVEQGEAALPSVEYWKLPSGEVVSRATAERMGVQLPERPAAVAESATAEAPKLPLIADFEPKRIAKTTSNDLAGDQKRGGLYAIAIEKDGVVEVRNVYERKDGTRTVENIGTEGKRTGRSLDALKKAGWTVRMGPFQLAEQTPHLNLSMTPEQFDAQVADSRGLHDTVTQAINDGRGDIVVEQALKATDPKAWQAVELMQSLITDTTGTDRSRVLQGLATPIDSVASRDSLRASAAIKKLSDMTAGKLLRTRDGKIFGLFTPDQWNEFTAAVAEPKPSEETGRGAPLTTAEELLLRKFSKDGDWNAARKDFVKWGQSISDLGTATQVGKEAFAGKGRGAVRNVEESGEGVSDQLSGGDLRSETETVPLSSSEGQAARRGLLESYGIGGDAVESALAEMRDYETLTRDDVTDILTHGPEFEPFRQQLRSEGGTADDVARVIDTLLSLHEQPTGSPIRGTDVRSENEAGGSSPAEEGVLHPPGRSADETRRSQPAAQDRRGLQSDSEITRQVAEADAALRDAGVPVEAIQMAEDSVSEFVRQTGGSFDPRRGIRVVRASLAQPTALDLAVVIHEATHALFPSLSDDVRAGVARAVDRLWESDKIPDNNLSLQNPDPAVRMQERLAVLMEGEGIHPGQAKDMASRAVRFVKDLYFQMARAVTAAMGFTDTADAFALRYTRNRLDGLLNGDFAPQSLVNALGGRPLTWPEKAMMLPGIGKTVGRALNGAMTWAPKVPDTAEALAYNLDMAFSRPPPTEAEANLRKGVDAVNAILADNTKVLRGAMYRPEVGSITLEWGNPGDPAKSFRGGFGLGHILARRAVVGGVDPATVIANLVETIAYGDASAPYGGEGDTRVKIDDGTNSVVLSLARHGQRETWVITSFDKNASVTGESGKSVPSPKTTQGGRAFSPADLVAVTDKLRMEPRLRAVKAMEPLFSRPLPAAIGAVDNPANAINRDVATINHAIDVEGLVERTITGLPDLARAAAAAGRRPGEWFRGLFRFEDPNALKAQALSRLDPTTQQPVQGANPGQTFGDFAAASNAEPAKIHAYQAARARLQTLSGRLVEDQHDLGPLQNKRQAMQQGFLQAHKDYLNAEGLTSLVHQGVREILVRERRMADSTGKQVGVVMQQLRELDSRQAEMLDRDYAPVFKKLFAGSELRGRNLFDLLDQMVNEANVDFHGQKVTEIRQKLAERVAAGMASPEMGMLLNATPESRALLATVVAYGKTHADVLLQIERRRGKNVAERLALQQQLDDVLKTRDITNQAVRDLPKTAKLEERARLIYGQKKQQIRAINEHIQDRQTRIAAAEAGIPIYQTALESLQKDIGGGAVPEYTYGNGMAYPVPTQNAKGGFDLVPHELSLDSTQGITDRKTIDQHLDQMTRWLGMKERANELDGSYYNVKGARDELAKFALGFESDLRTTQSWIRNNIFLPVGAKVAATGLPVARKIEQMFNRMTGAHKEMDAAGEKLATASVRTRDALVGVLNRGRKTPDMTVNRLLAEVVGPAKSVWEKSRDLQEIGLTPEQLDTRVTQRVLNELLRNPATESFVRGKEQAVAQALRAHIDAEEKASAFFNGINREHGLGVRDERIIVPKANGDEAVGIRDSLPVGPKTFASRGSSIIGRAYRVMRSMGWGTFKDDMPRLVAAYKQGGAAALDQAMAKYVNEQVAGDFVGAMATTDTYSSFDAPVLSDGITKPEADPVRAAQAWRASQGSVGKFIDALYAAHNGTGDRTAFAEQTLTRLNDYFTALSRHLPQDVTGMSPDDLSFLSSNAMIDARVLDRWPTLWREYHSFDHETTRSMVKRTAAQIAFGRDTKNLAEMWTTMEREIGGTRDAHNSIIDRGTRQGLGGKALDQFVENDYVQRLGAQGKAEYARVERLVSLAPEVASAKKDLQTYFTQHLGTNDAARFAETAARTVAFGMLNNPGTSLNILSHLFGPVMQGGVSRETMRQVLNNWRYTGEGVAGSLAQAVGIDLLTSSRLHNLYNAEGYTDAATALQYISRTEDGLRSDLTPAESHETGAATRALQLFTRTISFGITPKGEASRFTAFRPLAPFAQIAPEMLRASTLSTWRRVESMVQSGLDHFAQHPADASDPNFKLTADVLKLKGAEHATFEQLRRRLGEGYGLDLTALAREALDRQAGPRDQNALLSKTSRAIVQGFVANELVLESNLATMTPKARTSGFMRFTLPLYGWFLRRTMQLSRTGLTPDDRYQSMAIARGLGSLGVMCAAGLGMGLLLDEYHDKVVGRKRNLRSVASLPSDLAQGKMGEAGLTMLENVNRAGTFGLLGEVLNTVVGSATGGDNRAISFDQRVVMANSLLSLAHAIGTAMHEHDVDYTNVLRPVIQSMGGNSALQYLDIGNHALGLDNTESRFLARVNATNRLKVAGRELGMEVRSPTGAVADATPLTPILSRMVLAAYAGDRTEFLAHWRDAVKEAATLGKADPVAYVRNEFASRNPLRAAFQHLSQDDYARLLRSMDDRGRQQVQLAVNRFNAYASSLDAKPYTGSTGATGRLAGGTVRQLRGF